MGWFRYFDYQPEPPKFDLGDYVVRQKAGQKAPPIKPHRPKKKKK